MPLLCLFIHLYFCCFVRCKHAAPNFAEIWVSSCAAAVFGCCEVLQITQSANESVGRCVAHAGFSHSFSALIKLTSWYFPIIRKRVFSSRLRLDFISCFVSVINTWTWRGVAVYHQLCSPTTPHPPGCWPRPHRYLSVSSPAELPVAFFQTLNSSVSCSRTCDIWWTCRLFRGQSGDLLFLWQLLATQPHPLPPQPPSQTVIRAARAQPFDASPSLWFGCVYTPRSSSSSLSCLHASVIGLHARSLAYSWHVLCVSVQTHMIKGKLWFV